MLNFKSYLTEVFNLPTVDFHDHRIATLDKYVFDFTVKDREFSAIFERDDPESVDGPQICWGGSYTYKKASGQSSYAMQHFNDGSEFKILSTFLAYFLAFAKDMDPDKMYFGADKGEGPRAAVYERIMKRHLSTIGSMGYDFYVDDKKYQKEFAIIKKQFSHQTV